MPVNVQVESFNYNEWGTLPGKVTEISSDFLTDSQGNSFYKVKCQMERNYLMLKSGQNALIRIKDQITNRMICRSTARTVTWWPTA